VRLARAVRQGDIVRMGDVELEEGTQAVAMRREAERLAE
jgi:hypothetical protein